MADNRRWRTYQYLDLEGVERVNSFIPKVNSLYCLSDNSYVVSLDDLVLDQLIIP